MHIFKCGTTHERNKTRKHSDYINVIFNIISLLEKKIKELNNLTPLFVNEKYENL